MVVRPSYDQEEVIEEKDKSGLLGEYGSGGARGARSGVGVVGELVYLVYLVCFVLLFGLVEEQGQLQQEQVEEEQEVPREESQICVFYRRQPYDQSEKKKSSRKNSDNVFCTNLVNKKTKQGLKKEINYTCNFF